MEIKKNSLLPGLNEKIRGKGEKLMNQLMRMSGVFFVAFLVLGLTASAQDKEPPFTWKGEGVSTMYGNEGPRDVDFDIELKVDEEGKVTGYAATDDGEAPIKKMLYGERKDHLLPEGRYSREIIVVVMVNEYGDNPFLIIMKGNVLMDQYFYGETFFTRYEKGGVVDKGFQLDNKIATPLSEDPSAIKAALQECMPGGHFKTEGKFMQEKPE